MKHIHMAGLCIAATLSLPLSAASTTHTQQAQDAQAIADATHEHVKHSINPHYEALRKSIKALIKGGSDDAKTRMRTAQKKLQTDCAAAKKHLQQECGEKKRALYKGYVASRSTVQQEHHADLAQLEAAHKAALQRATTLTITLHRASELVTALTKQAEKMGETGLVKALEEETAWLDNLEKTSKKAAISFEQPLKKPLRESKKKATSHQ